MSGLKSEFHVPQVSFLGYVINQQEVVMDSSKVKDVVDWPVPTPIKELQHFLGCANF